MFERSTGNQILDLDKDVSPIDDNEIEEYNEQYAEDINDEDAQEILEDLQEENVYATAIGSNRNEEDYDSDDNKKKAQVNKILKYTKRKMTKKMKIIKTLKKIYLMKYDTLLIVTTRR